MSPIASVIKYEGDNSTFIKKHPCEDFNTLTQLIVHESQEAIFFMNGQALDLFGPGRYTLETWYGRAFIHIYYAISPTLVKWFGHTEWFKKMWKGKLDRMVADLKAKGVEDTPYEDRLW